MAAASATASPGPSQPELGVSDRVLLVTAHPDDEALFFAPVLHALARQGAQLHLLCLSNGDADGLGAVREKELEAACRLLQVRSVHVAHDQRMQDGLRNAWPREAVAQHVRERLRQVPCDTVLTFDAHGVSGHLNHRCVHEGVRWLLAEAGRQLGVCQAWQLVSEPLLAKYSGPAALLWCAAVRRRGQALVLGGRVRSSVRAMAAHASQWVWYRRLFVLTSSYTYVNRLARLELGGA